MSPETEQAIASYPADAREQFKKIRAVILDVANKNDLGQVEETLKWGQPSYLIKGGSTVRVSWQPEEPSVMKIYFHCQTKLVETFRELYRDEFQFEGTRALVIPLNEKIDGMKNPLRQCVLMALKYHKLKHLTLLGA